VAKSLMHDHSQEICVGVHGTREVLHYKYVLCAVYF
jgi:hypothetical protein